MERGQAAGRQDRIAAGFARLAAADARLDANGLSRADRAALARLRSDIAAALVLLRGREEGSLGRAECGAAAAPLRLALPADVMARLPAAARLAALDLAALADGVAAALAAQQAEAGPTKSEKPRRRQGRPRLELVIP